MEREQQHPDAAFIRADYTVRRHWVHQILRIMNMQKCTFVDAFASSSNRRFEDFIDKAADAMQVAWPADKVMWCNPPWSLLEKLPSKMQQEQRCCLVIMPAWTSKKWQWTILGWSTKVIYFEKDTKLFEVDGHPCHGIRWGVYACYVPQEALAVRVNQVMGYVGPTTKRKSRRRKRRAAWQQVSSGGDEASFSQACDQGHGGIPVLGGPWVDKSWW